MFGKRKRQASEFPDIVAKGGPIRRAGDDAGDDDADYLDGVTSDLTDFGTTGGRGFAQAWDDSDQSESAQHRDLADSFGSTAHDSSGRDLDKRSRRVVVGVVAVAALVAGGFFLSQRTEAPDAESASAAETRVITPPGAPRVYDGPAEITLSREDSIDGVFIVETIGENPTPVPPNDSAGAPAPATYGTVLWGGRAHVAVIGPPLDSSDLCIVATLVTTDLGVVDIAATGACSAELGQTGDRVACVSDSLVLLEVWPTDPREITPKPPTTAVRLRVERAMDDGSIVSRRGSMQIAAETASEPSPFLQSLTDLGGQPGDAITITSSDGLRSGSCTLLDRTNVSIQLLPS